MPDNFAATAASLQRLANQYAYEPPIDYRKNPLGSVEGEAGLTAPYNAAQEAVVYCRNWSALLERRILKDAVSPQRGGVVACRTKGSPWYGKTPEELRRRVREEGEDCNWYEMEVKPTTFYLRFDGLQYPITPDLEEVDVKQDDGTWVREKQPRWQLVPSGVWDLYMGNYERLHSRDQGERAKEMEQMRGRGLYRFVLSEDNPEGFLQFKREDVKVTRVLVDKEKLPADAIIEV